MSAPRLPAWSTPHGSALIAVLVILLAVLLAGCDVRQETAPTAAAAPGTRAAVVETAVSAVAVEVQDAAGDAASEVQEATVATVIPAVLDVQQIVQEALPQPAARDAGAEPVSSPVSPAAVALIVREEIISPAYYAKKLQGFACPGETSGPTIGVGSDLGVHTPTRIASDWSIHPHVGTLMQGSGVIGFGPCRGFRAAHPDVRTPFEIAQQVFATKMLPAYHAQAKRTFRNGWTLLTENAKGSLVVTGYARGFSMRDPKGSPGKRAEMRQLRDVCVPAGDLQCMATAYRAMCARYVGRSDGEGLCKRFRATADLAVQA